MLYAVAASVIWYHHRSKIFSRGQGEEGGDVEVDQI